MSKALFSVALCFSLVSGLQAASEPDDTDLCTAEAATAGLIMELRQKGASAARLMEIADGNPAAQALVLVAYDQPLYQTDERKEEIKQEFQNAAYMQCFKRRLEPAPKR